MEQQNLSFPREFVVLDPRFVWKRGKVVAITTVPPPPTFKEERWEFITGCISKERADRVAHLVLTGEW